MSAPRLDWEDVLARGLAGRGIDRDEAMAVVSLDDPEEVEGLFDTADALRRAHKGNAVNTCGITNAKSGRCPEKCAFCAQSAFFPEADSPRFPLKDPEVIAREAEAAAAAGVREFSVVTAGRALTRVDELEAIKEALRRIRERTPLQTCASLGLMTREQLAELKEAGLMSFHHNLETARSHHPNIVQTHTYDDEVAAVRAAKEVGLYVCCGGIFGMGETWAQRVELAMDLQALQVDSVPINFLDPRPGTPLADRHDLTADDCLRIIALLRLVLPDRDLIVCGGRQVNLGDRQAEIFRAGANGLMMGDYLTTRGSATSADRAMLAEQGLVIRPPPGAAPAG